MSEKMIKLLNELGFNTRLRGAEYFASIVNQLKDILKDLDEKKDVPDFYPKKKDLYYFIDRLYVEDYAFYYECGRKQYLNDIDEFIASREIKNKKQEELNKKVFGSSSDRELMILKIANYLNAHEKEFSDDEKIFVKK